ncbi:hypothetical protein H0H93_007518 [Arthromyces matolae]|nr:hypothetical protein H0H93_007518 [Arthromyces matolae]
MNMVGDFTLVHIINNTVGSFLYGSFAILSFAAFAIMINRGVNSGPARIMFSSIVLSFILLSINWVIDVYFFIWEVRYELLEPSAATFNSQTIADFPRVSFKWIITQRIVQQLMLTLSDVIVIWRAWAIVSNVWIISFPVFFAVAGTGCGFGYIAIISSSYDVYAMSFYRSLSTPNVMWDVAQALSFVANAIATLLIARTVWLHYRSRKQLLVHKRPSRALQVLSIIIDTGLAFLVLQGMYPTIVIFLVKQKTSLDETFSLSVPNGATHSEMAFDRTITIGPLVFASSHTTTHTLSPSNDGLHVNDVQPFTRATV